MSVFIFVLLIVFLFFPAVTYILFWYDTANSPYRDELEEVSGGKAGRWILRGFVSSILSQLTVVITWPLAFIRRLWQSEADPADTSSPVILIHGLYHNASAWVLYRRWLRQAGYRRVYQFNYNSLKYNFHEISDQLDKWMEKTARSFPGEAAVIVGHSLGGLLARAYVGKREGGKGPRVRAVVTLGAPHRGSRMVVFAFGGLAKSLAYESPLMGELGGLETPPEVECTAVYSAVDNMVLPAESLKSPPGWKGERSEPVCHIAMLYHRPTFEQVMIHLK